LKQGGPARKIDVAGLISGTETVETALSWVRAQDGLPVVYTSDDPANVAATQERFGSGPAAEAIEGFFGALAGRLVDTGFTRLVSAGGETSGAIIGALGVTALEIGPMIAPGVPALRVEGRNLAVALKSGNFGGPDFFARAAAILAGKDAAQ
jgi:uncharacterized protein YgbK (DUF1537 family)